MKASEQYFPVVLFLKLYKLVLTLESLKYHAFLEKEHAEFFISI